VPLTPRVETAWSLAHARFWWSNVAYINNLVPWHSGETNECFYHAWYLADDMQASAVPVVSISDVGS